MKHVSAVSLPQADPSFGTTLARVALIGALAVSGVAVAQCKHVKGTFPHLGPASCPVGVNACFQTPFSGSLDGMATSILTSFTPLPDQPNVVTFSARSTITLADGTVNTVDAGAGTGCNPLSGISCASSNEVLTILSGTGAYAGAYGTIFLSGSYMSADLAQGGAYEGQICTAKKQ